MDARRRDFVAIAAMLAAYVALGCGSPLPDPGTGTAGGGGTNGRMMTNGGAGTGGTMVSSPADGGQAPCTKPVPGEIPSNHRAAAITCGTHSGFVPDGMSCTTSADCRTDAAATGLNFCLKGRCSFDACVVDADCGSNAACICGDDGMYTGGNASIHPNICVPGDCRVDADCGPAGFCSPTSGYCGVPESYHCHRSADRCVDAEKDCASCGEDCVYSPAVGAFTCGLAATCNG